MLGAIIGDTVGSIYEFCNINSTKFPLFSSHSEPTDDSVMTMAVAEWLLSDPERTHETLEECMVRWGHRYPRAGYGSAFSRWLFNPDFLGGYRDEYNNFDDIPSGRHPYNSWGNGSAMRCSACGWVAETLNEALELAKRSAEITHNHPEGIKGAQATAAAIWMARHNATKEEIKEYITDKFGYDLNRDCNDIRPDYYFDVSCQGTVPEAIIAFLDSWDFESAIRLAVSLGGDSDTLTCITGGIAEAFYKEIPEPIIAEIRNRLDTDWWDIINGIYAQAEKALETPKRLKLVFLTGAGISKESGIDTFRDPMTGLWEKYNPMELCSAIKLAENPQLVLDFYNMRRLKIYEAEPNHAHEMIAQMEKKYDITIITQNVDDLHERAGSNEVWHVHGDLTKVTSSKNRFDMNCIQYYPLNEPIMVGQQAADGSQLRPFVVMMDEYLPPLNVAIKRIQEADIFVIIGTSMSIGAGGFLCNLASPQAKKYIIDPVDYRHMLLPDFHWIAKPATSGVDELVAELEILEK